MVAEADVGSRKRCAGLAHSFVHDDVVRIGTLGGTHIAHVGVVGVLRLAPCANGIQVEERGQLEAQAQFHTVVFLLYACHRDIRERVDVVEIEVLPLGHMVQTAVIGIETGPQP